MLEQRTTSDQGFKIICITCGVKIRDHASDDSYGMCLRCFCRPISQRNKIAAAWFAVQSFR